jgi:hypothetical protein
MQWHEFRLAMRYFPGQTLYHDGLSIVRESGESLFFTGDSFTPSGMDDYCLQNRDLLKDGQGYLATLKTLHATKPGTWLLNQHVAPMFRYNAEQMAFMTSELTKRRSIIASLSPWPDANYMVDESWARMYPYGSTVDAGQRVTIELKIMNHSERLERYTAAWHAPDGLRLIESHGTVTIRPNQEGKVRAMFEATRGGLHIVTADVGFAGRTLPQWTEAMVRVK